MTDTVKKHSKLKLDNLSDDVNFRKYETEQFSTFMDNVAYGFRSKDEKIVDSVNQVQQYREALEALHEKCREEIADYEYTGEYELVTTAFKGAK